jgi:hypothetical protein
MTPEIFAFVVMPGLAVLVGLVGYVIFAITDPERKSARHPSVSELFHFKAHSHH